MIKVLVITPYRGLSELISELHDQLHDFSITIEHGDLDKGLYSLEKYEKEAFDFIISRGGTADILRENTTIPVLDLEISGYDVLRIILLLKGFENSKIAVIGFKNVIQNFQSVSELMDLNIQYIELQHKDNVMQTLVDARDKGIDIVVGDTITNKVANDLGMQGILITSGKESILQTFQDVKFLHRELNKLKDTKSIYENAIHLSNDGVIIFSQDGTIKFANNLFYSIVGASLETRIGESIFSMLPFIPALLYLATTEDLVTYQLTNNNHEKLYTIYIESFIQHKETFYLLKLKETVDMKTQHDGAKITIALTNRLDTPRYLFKSKTYYEIFNQMNRFIERRQAFCLVGEKGAGKRLLIDTLENDMAYSVELNMYQLSTKLFNQLMKLLDEINLNTIIHLSGFENLTGAQQLRLEEKLLENKHIFILTLTGAEELLLENELKLNPSFKKHLLEHYIYIPNLRDIKNDIETFIQSFILKYNEQYGKQIVGIKSTALEALKRYPWPNNLMELRSVIYDAYKVLNSEIINDEVIDILKERTERSFLSFATPINLHQSLANIEKDIILMIMEEEDFNQTKVAERLNINRSTLWRKLKEIEQP